MLRRCFFLADEVEPSPAKSPDTMLMVSRRGISVVGVNAGWWVVYVVIGALLVIVTGITWGRQLSDFLGWDGPSLLMKRRKWPVRINSSILS